MGRGRASRGDDKCTYSGKRITRVIHDQDESGKERIKRLDQSLRIILKKKKKKSWPQRARALKQTCVHS